MTIPPITPTQQHLITLTFRFRFLSRFHYQILLNHKSPSLVKSWLSDLTTKQYFVSERSTRFGENTKPTVYHLGKNAIRFLKTTEGFGSTSLQYLYHEASRSPTFRTHCLTVADFCCNLLRHARAQGKSITFFTKADYRGENVENENLQLLHALNPDSYYTFPGTGIPKRCFIEIIDEITPAFVMRGRIRKYIRCFQDENWEEALNTSRFPSLVFIVPTEKKLRSLKRAITMVKNEFADEEINAAIKCNIALVSDMQTQSITDPIWKHA